MSPLKPLIMTDTELLNFLAKEGTLLWEMDGGWNCDLQMGPVGEGNTPREAIIDAFNKLSKIKSKRRKRA